MYYTAIHQMNGGISANRNADHCRRTDEDGDALFSLEIEKCVKRCS